MEPQEKMKPLLLQRETVFGNLLRLAIIVFESGSFLFSVYGEKKKRTKM